MKYKIIGICTVLLTIAAVLIVSFSMPEDNGLRYVQHRDSQPKAACSGHAFGELCTHLPIIRIDTGAREIPGREIRDPVSNKIMGYTLAADGQTSISASFEAIDSASGMNHPSDAPAISAGITIRLRGHSSRAFDKPNYYIQLVNPDGSNNAQPLLGMDAHHEWALHGPFLDKSLIRNYMWYNIAGEIMDYSPNVRFCELILNGEYKGLYLLTETITAGRNGARLSLSVSKKNNTFSGYALRLDWGDSNQNQRLHPFTNYTLIANTQHEIVYPGTANLSDDLLDAIKDDFSAFEKMLYSYDFDSADYGYHNYIDVDSFIDYCLINELCCNYDAGYRSTYIYKDIDGKYRMCVWDFNSACDFYQERAISAEDFQFHDILWYQMLFKDQNFTDRVIERYHELRKTYFSEEYLCEFIDSTVAYLGDAVSRNYDVWGYSFAPEHDLLLPVNRNVRSHAESIGQIKAFLADRIAFLDENIEMIRQYSAESKNKKYNEIAS